MKLLFSDLDGTLLTDEKRILDIDRNAIDELLLQGHKLVLCTGRPLVSAKRLAHEYGFDKPGFFLVSFNGGLIYDFSQNKSILTRTIPVEYAKFIMDSAHKMHMHAHTYALDKVVSEYETEQLKTYCKTMQMDYVIVNDIRKYFANKSLLNIVIKPPIKVNVITPLDNESLKIFREKMRKFTAGKLFDVFSKPEMLEFSNLESNKGSALKFMANKYGVKISDTVAVGDCENDCPMIKAAGIGIAMKNASDEAKKSAAYITKNSNNEGGIAEIIHKFILNYRM